MTKRLVASARTVEAPRVADPRVADVVLAGRLRAALFPPTYRDDPATGELQGTGPGVVFVDLARALAARIGVELALIGYRTPSEVLGCLRARACDVAFMGIERRARGIGYTCPVVQLDYTCLVPAGSPIHDFADADRPGVRIAVVRDHLSTRALRGRLRRAVQVATEVPDAAFELLRAGHVDAFAQLRSALLDYSARLPGSRVLEHRYGANLVGMAVAKGQAGQLAYVSEFIKETKASGWVRRAIECAGLDVRGVQATPEKSPDRH